MNKHLPEIIYAIERTQGENEEWGLYGMRFAKEEARDMLIRCRTGTKRTIDCEILDKMEVDAYLGYDLVATAFTAYHWEEARELTQEEYDKISDDDNEKILQGLTDTIDYSDEP